MRDVPNGVSPCGVLDLDELLQCQHSDLHLTIADGLCLCEQLVVALAGREHAERVEGAELRGQVDLAGAEQLVRCRLQLAPGEVEAMVGVESREHIKQSIDVARRATMDDVEVCGRDGRTVDDGRGAPMTMNSTRARTSARISSAISASFGCDTLEPAEGLQVSRSGFEALERRQLERGSNEGAVDLGERPRDLRVASQQRLDMVS